MYLLQIKTRLKGFWRIYRYINVIKRNNSLFQNSIAMIPKNPWPSYLPKKPRFVTNILKTQLQKMVTKQMYLSTFRTQYIFNHNETEGKSHILSWQFQLQCLSIFPFYFLQLWLRSSTNTLPSTNFLHAERWCQSSQFLRKAATLFIPQTKGQSVFSHCQTNFKRFE